MPRARRTSSSRWAARAACTAASCSPRRPRDYLRDAGLPRRGQPSRHRARTGSAGERGRADARSPSAAAPACPRVLACLLDLGFETTAVVTMADDGGSSGHAAPRARHAAARRRAQLPRGAAPTRTALLARVFQYRFPHGEGLAGHALGNLDHRGARRHRGRLPRGARGRRRDCSARAAACCRRRSSDVVLVAETCDGPARSSGQARLADERGPGRAACTSSPRRPPAYAPALEALARPTSIVIGPGSLYTSLIPNFLVDGRRRRAARELARDACLRVQRRQPCAARRGGMDAADHVRGAASTTARAARSTSCSCTTPIALPAARRGVEPVRVRRRESSRGSRRSASSVVARRPRRPRRPAAPRSRARSARALAGGGRRMSFTAEVKEELSRVEPEARLLPARPSSRRSSASRARCTSAGTGRFRLEVATETAPVARKTIKLLHEVYGLKTELTVRRSVLHKANNYLITVPTQPKLAGALADLGILDEEHGLALRHRRRARASKRLLRDRYLRGAFLGGGFVADPHGDFHFELTAETEQMAEDLVALMGRFEIEARVTQRRGTYAVYLKGAEPIVTFLALVGAHRALLRTEDVRIIKSMRNDVNRLVNAEIANQQKTAEAAMGQIEAINAARRDAWPREPAAGAAGARRAAARESGRVACGNSASLPTRRCRSLRYIIGCAASRNWPSEVRRRSGTTPTAWDVRVRAVCQRESRRCAVADGASATRRDRVWRSRSASTGSGASGVSCSARWRATRHRGRGGQRPDRRRRRSRTCSSTTRSTAASASERRGRRRRLHRRRPRRQGARRARPGRAAVGRRSASTSSSSRPASSPTRPRRKAHIDAGAKKVIISAPAKNEDITDRPRRQRRQVRSREAPHHLATRRAPRTAWRRSRRCCATASASSAAS